MNKIGICSWTLGIEDLSELMSKVKALGLDGLQFCGNVEKYDSQYLKNLAEKFKLEIFAIDPSIELAEDDSSANTEKAIEFYKKAIDFAVAAGAPMVCIQGLSKWTVNCANRTECWSMLVGCCKTLDTYAQLKKVKLVYKCVNRYESSMIRTAEEGRALLQQVGHKNMGIILDSFHMNLEEANPVEALEKSKNMLAAYHIADSNQAGIGRGQVDFAKHHQVLKDMNFNGLIMVEVSLPELAPGGAPTTLEAQEHLDEEIRRSIRVWKNL